MLLDLNPATWFTSVPPEWAILFISMIPITEIRASIPIGIEIYGLPVWKVWIIGVVGDIIPAIVILAVLSSRLFPWLMNSKILGKHLTKHLKRAEKKFEGKYSKYGAIALIAFVGVPLPFTGSWTGSFAASVFNIPFKKAIVLISIGVCVAATLISIITVSAGGFFRWLF